MSTGWSPLLDERDAAAAWEAIDAVASDLLRAAPGSATLAAGDAGIALFFHYLSREKRQPAPAPHLERAVAALQHQELDASLYTGFLGVAWTVEHLRGQDQDLNQAVDEALLGFLDDDQWAYPFDLVAGLVGMGVYALERGPRGARILRRIVELLGRTAERRDGRAAWRAALELLPGDQIASSSGYYNLGIAHGVGGVLAFLSFAKRAGSEVEPLLGETKRWLAERRGPLGGYPCLVDVTDLSGKQLRSAWCHGDPGLAAAWLASARAGADGALEKEALRLARGLAGLSARELGVNDAGLCHGAAGLGHLFNRLFQTTREPLFAAEARHWFRAALELRRPGSGVGGFVAAGVAEGDAVRWESDPGFLTGAAGVGLALLAAAGSVEPAWDRALLVSAHG